MRSKHITVKLLFTVVLFLSLSSCTTLLDEDFESYNAGQAPGGPIPGPPDCDSIVIHGMPVQFTVSTTNALSGNKSMEFEPAFGEGESMVDFRPCPPADTQQSIIIKWQGRLETSTDSPGVAVRITDLEDIIFRSYLIFNIRPTNMEIRSGATLIDTLNGDFRSPHTVIARIVPGVDQYFISVIAEGVNEEEGSLEGDLSHVVDISPPGVVLLMEWQFGASVSHVYRIDEVSISRRNN